MNKRITTIFLLSFLGISAVLGHPVKSKEEHYAKRQWELAQEETAVVCAMSAALVAGAGSIAVAVFRENDTDDVSHIQKGLLIAGGVIFAIGLLNLTRNWEGSGAQKDWYERKKWDYRVMQATGFHQMVAVNRNINSE